MLIGKLSVASCGFSPCNPKKGSHHHHGVIISAGWVKKTKQLTHAHTHVCIRNVTGKKHEGNHFQESNPLREITNDKNNGFTRIATTATWRRRRRS